MSAVPAKNARGIRGTEDTAQIFHAVPRHKAAFLLREGGYEEAEAQCGGALHSHTDPLAFRFHARRRLARLDTSFEWVCAIDIAYFALFWSGLVLPWFNNLATGGAQPEPCALYSALLPVSPHPFQAWNLGTCLSMGYPALRPSRRLARVAVV
jgi:hypothetical protein